MLQQRLVVKSPRVAHALRKARDLSPLGQARALEANRVLMGTIMGRLVPDEPASLADTEFKVFSQFGEDGIIQYLVRHAVDVPTGLRRVRRRGLPRVQHPLPARQRQLARAGHRRQPRVRPRHPVERASPGATTSRPSPRSSPRQHQRPVRRRTASRARSGCSASTSTATTTGSGTRSTSCRPGIVVVEYNSVFGAERARHRALRPDLPADGRHHSNLYCGASLPALRELGERKGYAFVGCNSNGNNAFFVTADRLGSTAGGAPPGRGTSSRASASRATSAAT